MIMHATTEQECPRIRESEDQFSKIMSLQINGMVFVHGVPPKKKKKKKEQIQRHKPLLNPRIS